MNTASHDRRIHARTKARITARLSQGREAVEGVIENIGEGGVFFATEELEVIVDEASPVALEFTGRHGSEPTTLRRTGRVLRTERYFDGQNVVRAFAVRFDEDLDLTDMHFE